MSNLLHKDDNLDGTHNGSFLISLSHLMLEKLKSLTKIMLSLSRIDLEIVSRTCDKWLILEGAASGGIHATITKSLGFFVSRFPRRWFQYHTNLLEKFYWEYYFLRQEVPHLLYAWMSLCQTYHTL